MRIFAISEGQEDLLFLRDKKVPLNNLHFLWHVPIWSSRVPSLIIMNQNWIDNNFIAILKKNKKQPFSIHCSL